MLWVTIHTFEQREFPQFSKVSCASQNLFSWGSFTLPFVAELPTGLQSHEPLCSHMHWNLSFLVASENASLLSTCVCSFSGLWGGTVRSQDTGTAFHIAVEQKLQETAHALWFSSFVAFIWTIWTMLIFLSTACALLWSQGDVFTFTRTLLEL